MRDCERRTDGTLIRKIGVRQSTRNERGYNACGLFISPNTKKELC